jgi:hypothetical protein
MEMLAAHFGPLAPAILAMARHVEEDHESASRRPTCGIDITHREWERGKG